MHDSEATVQYESGQHKNRKDRKRADAETANAESFPLTLRPRAAAPARNSELMGRLQLSNFTADGVIKPKLAKIQHSRRTEQTISLI